MQNLTQPDSRVQSYLLPRLKRMITLGNSDVVDRRSPQGRRHTFVDMQMALVAGLLTQRKGIRDVEQLSADLGLGRKGHGISDGALTHALELAEEHDFDALLVRTVKDMVARKQLRPVELLQSWIAIDGKYSTLNHHCGGYGQKFEGNGSVHWRLGVLRAVVVSAPSMPAIGQWPMGPVDSADRDAEKIKHTGEITNLPPFVRWLRAQYGDLASNFTLDAGLWSKQTFLSMDAEGLGALCGLKENKPELHAEVSRVLRTEQQRRAPQAETGWEPCRGGKIRRRLWRTTVLDGWNDWTHLRQAAVIEQTTRDNEGNDTIELRYFVTNATTGMLNPRQLLLLVRRHWGIENDCNWSFDMQFGEDDRAWCTRNTAQLVLGVLRMIAYNLLQHLRKSHATVRHQHVQPTPRPWRNLFESVYRSLIRIGHDFGRLVRESGANRQRAARC